MMSEAKAIFELQPRIDWKPVDGNEKINGFLSVFMHPNTIAGEGAIDRLRPPAARPSRSSSRT